MSLLSRLAKGVGTFTKNIGKGISHLAKGISHGIGSVAKGFGKVVRSTAKALWDNPFLRTIALGSAAYFTGGMLAPMLSTSLNIGMGAASMLGSTASGAILGGLGSMAAGKGFGHGALFGGLTGLAAGYLPSLVGANNTTQGGLLGPILGKGKSMVEGITHFADAHPGMAMMALAGVQNAFTPDQIDLQNNQAKLQRQNLAYRQALNQVPVDNSGMVVSGGSGSVGYMQGGGIQGGGQQGQNTVPVQNGLLVTATPWVYQ